MLQRLAHAPAEALCKDTNNRKLKEESKTQSLQLQMIPTSAAKTLQEEKYRINNRRLMWLDEVELNDARYKLFPLSVVFLGGISFLSYKLVKRKFVVFGGGLFLLNCYVYYQMYRMFRSCITSVELDKDKRTMTIENGLFIKQQNRFLVGDLQRKDKVTPSRFEALFSLSAVPQEALEFKGKNNEGMEKELWLGDESVFSNLITIPNKDLLLFCLEGNLFELSKYQLADLLK